LFSIKVVTVRGLWEVNKVFDVAEKGFGNSNSIKGGAGGMSALNATCFLSSGFVRPDDVAMVVPGMFSVINGLGDMLTVVGGVVCYCGRGRELVWVGMLAVVGLDLFSGLRNAPRDCSSSFQWLLRVLTPFLAVVRF
jgi:hypothetical protein